MSAAPSQVRHRPTQPSSFTKACSSRRSRCRTAAGFVPMWSESSFPTAHSPSSSAATFACSDCGPQAKGPVNLRPSMVEACVLCSLLGSLDLKLDFHDGMRDAVEIVVAPRTTADASPPAPVSHYQMVNLKLVDVILEA